jgi:hypothetical protein
MSTSAGPDTSRPKPLYMACSRPYVSKPQYDYESYASVSFKSDGGADSISFHHWSLCAYYDSRLWIVGGLDQNSLWLLYVVLSNLSLSY